MSERNREESQTDIMLRNFETISLQLLVYHLKRPFTLAEIDECQHGSPGRSES